MVPRRTLIQCSSGQTYRPAYPQSFFDRIYKHHEQFSDSWDEANDCGSGAGQCAEQLAKRFKKVHVSEPNELYLNFAQKRLSALGHPKDKFAFYAEGGEKSSVKSNSLDLLTICEALHWCDIELAMKEFTRQLKSGGTFVIAHYTKPYCATDGKLSQLWDELWALGLGKPADDMRKRGFRNAGSAYDQVGFPEDIWQPGTQRILTNCKGNEKFMYRQGVDPPAESKVGENDKRIFVDNDEEWIVDADIAWLKEVYLAMVRSSCRCQTGLDNARRLTLT